MMETRHSSRSKWVLFGTGLVLFLGLAALVAVLVVRRVVAQSQAEQTPPAVLVRYPESGASFFPDTVIEVQAEAWGSSPIVGLGLWVDGKNIEQQLNPQEQDLAFRARFELTVPEGQHVLVARAVDGKGLVGQSLPISFSGDPASGSGPSVLNWPVEDGESLADVAGRLGQDEGGLRDANPAIGGGSLPGGTVVQIPLPPTDGGAPTADVIMPEPIPVDIPSTPPLGLITAGDMIGSLLQARNLLLPKAPDGMQAMFLDCSMILHWDDQSEGEQFFEIWMAGLGQSARIIARASSSPGTGPVWVKLDAPRTGIYSFWVQAVNFIGSQPSEVVWVAVPPSEGCAAGLATHVKVDLQDLSVQGGYDRFYCYVSANGRPAMRFPPQDGIFIQLLGENIMIGGKLSFEVPIPDPRVLALEGECLGWIGGDLVNLGPFEKAVPEEEWDGRELVIDNGAYRIQFTALLVGPLEVSSLTQSQYDLTLPAPYDLRLVTQLLGGDRVRHELHWRWDGDPSAITGFTVYIDGTEFAVAQDTSHSVLLPTDCGKSIRFQVAANGTEATSLPSEELAYATLPCAVSARVEFLSLNIYGEVDDESDCFLGFFPAENCYSYGKTCDGYQAVGWIFTQGTTYQKVEIGQWGGEIEQIWPVNCYGNEAFYPHSLALMTGGNNIFIVPLEPANPVLEVGAVFLDLDQGPNNIFCGFTSAERDLPFSRLTAQEWATYDETLEIDCSQETQATITIRITGGGSIL